MGGVPVVGAYRALQRGRDKVFSLAISSSFASFGRHSVIQPPVRIAGESLISVGAGVFVGAQSWLQVIADGGDGSPRLRIGDGTCVAGRCVISAVEQITIGRSVLMAGNVYIADHSHAFGEISRPVLDQGIDRIGAVEIGDGAWLGQNSVVLPGVRVGARAVVGANSVVRSDVPDGAVVAGTPARLLRMR